MRFCLSKVFPQSPSDSSVCECYRREKHFAVVVSVGQGGMSDTNLTAEAQDFLLASPISHILSIGTCEATT